MINLRFQKRKVKLPTSWLDVSYSDADKIGELSFDNVVLYYFGIQSASLPERQGLYLSGLLSFLDQDPPVYPHKGKEILFESLHKWYLITRDFMAGIDAYEERRVRELRLIDVLSISAYYSSQLNMVDNTFHELKEDLRTPQEKQSQPNGYWDSVQDELLFLSIGCPVEQDPFEWMKKIPLWRYFSSRLLSHKTRKAEKRAQELATNQ